MLERDAEGRPSRWEISTEPEFDANERDSWQALRELEAAICPHCGNYTAICSAAGGLYGDGFHVSQSVCYPSMVREATQRRIRRKYEKAQPDEAGFLPADGVHISVALVPDGSPDLLGLGAKPDS